MLLALEEYTGYLVQLSPSKARRGRKHFETSAPKAKWSHFSTSILELETETEEAGGFKLLRSAGLARNGVVACQRQRRTIHQVAYVSSKGGFRQGGDWRMPVGLHPFRVVDGIPDLLHRRAVRQAAHIVGEERTRKRRAWGMAVRLHVLRINHVIPHRVLCSAREEVLELRLCISLMGMHGLRLHPAVCSNRNPAVSRCHLF